MNEGFTKVYDLREDHELIMAVQRATLTTQDAGLVPEHGLFGSEEWWRAIGDGRIPVHEVKGVIASIYLSGHNDYPEFEIDDGRGRTSWTRMTSGGEPGRPERSRKEALYEAGRSVRLRYVEQQFRRALPGIPVSRRVIEIWIGGHRMRHADGSAG